MVDYNQTISESINVWGLSPTNKWGEATWGSSVWAFTDNGPITDTYKVLSDSISTVDVGLLSAGFNRTISEVIEVLSSMDEIRLTDKAGYNLVFRGSTTNLTHKLNSSYTKASSPVTVYTDISTSVTSWSTSI
jgi:hypothetical protein